MRDNHDGYPEIIDAYEREGQHFGVVRLVLGDGTSTVEFGVSMSGYFGLKRILNARLFEKLPGVGYRYFFTGSFTGAMKPEQGEFEFGVRIEQGTTAKKVQFSGPKSLLANLLWFAELKSTEETSGLKKI